MPGRLAGMPKVSHRRAALDLAARDPILAKLADNGAAGYFRVDWLTPDGLSTWGDGRMFLLGTDGYIELRKYVDVDRDLAGDQVYMVDGKGEHHFSVHGQVGYPFFGQLVRDVLERTENAMTQEHAFKAVELCIKAELEAERLTP